jgi:integrase
MKALTFKEAAEQMIQNMREVNNPLKEATFRATNSRLIAIHEALGAMPLGDITGRVVKDYVAARHKAGKSGSTVNSEYGIIRKVIESVLDENLNCLYPIQWATKALELPSAKPSKDRIHETPQRVIEKSVAAGCNPYSALIAALGFTGMRLGEMVACRIGTNNPDVTHWDAAESLIRVRTAIDVGAEHSAKTEKSADRVVDLCSAANEYLTSFASDRRDGFLFVENGKPLTRNRLYRAAEKLCGPYHGLRRARVTHLYRCAKTPADEQLMTFWLGHESEESQTEKYSRLCRNIDARREFAERAGVGFSLPIMVPHHTTGEEQEAQAVSA